MLTVVQLAAVLPLMAATAQAPAVPAPYRTPTIALVQPTEGSSIPRDRAVAVFRFMAGEPGDPIDVRTFHVSVKGVDQSAHFRVTAGEAWGALGDPGSIDSLLPPGTHEVTARVCSVRGACGATAAMVTIAGNADAGPATTTVPNRGDTHRSALAQFIARLLDALRRLIVP